MINKVILVGRLTKDPQLSYTPSGIAVAKFTIAVNRNFTNNSERETDFVNCVTWRKQAENIANYMKKGSLVGVEGSIQTSSYDGQEGKKVYVTEVVAGSVQFLESKNDQQQNNQPFTPQHQEPKHQIQYPPPRNNQKQFQQNQYLDDRGPF